MATSKEFLNYILEQVSNLNDITYRQMMGEYMLYYKGKLVAYLCDNRLLIKPTHFALAYIKELIFEAPYDGAKNMLIVENVDDSDYIDGLFNAIYNELSFSKKK